MATFVEIGGSSYLVYAARLRQQANMTSGLLVVGLKYTVTTLQAGDDFSNVGYVDINVEFTATGTTPTTWSNASVVVPTPIITAIANTLGGDVVWSRVGTGNYWGVLAGAFTENKTYMPPFGNYEDSNPYIALWGGSGAINGYYTISWRDENTINLISENVSGISVDISTLIGASTIWLPKIEVYP